MQCGVNTAMLRHGGMRDKLLLTPGINYGKTAGRCGSGKMGSIRIYRIILLRNPAVFVISGSWNESVVRSRRPSQQLGFRIYVDHYT